MNINQRNSMSLCLTVADRGQKIITAIYMVTDYISETEPLRHKIRTCSLDLMAELRRLPIQNDGVGIMPRFERIINIANDLSSYIDLAGAINLITSMNHGILKTEIINWKKKMSDSGNDDFLLDNVLNDLTRQENLPMDKGQNNVLKGQSTNINVLENKMTFKTSVKPIVSTSLKTKIIPSGNNDRKSRVIQIIRNKKEVTIKDIAGEINGCSEKTIQRELIALIKEGLLKRVGEKRWSRYSLV